MRRVRFRGPAGHRSRLTVADQLGDAWASLLAHPVRSVAMSLGVALGVAAAVATVALADTARLRVSSTFAALRPTKVDVLLSSAGSEPEGGGSPTGFPVAGVDRVRGLTGVEGVGAYADLQSTELDVSASRHGLDQLSSTPHLVGADSELLDAAEARTVGAGLDRWHVDHQARVALLGAPLADQLGIHTLDPDRYVFVSGVPLLVIGLVEDGGHLPSLAASVVVPSSTQAALFPSAQPALLVAVEPGAAPGVSRAIPFALDPAAPDAFNVPEPGDPRSLGQAVDTDLSGLGVYLALLSTLVGMIGIGSSTFGAIYERLGEFGLRRALGARPGHLRRQVLTECLLAGLAAGLVGAIAGIAVVVVSARLRGWVPVVDPRLVVAAPLLGLASGVGAAVVPAWKAGRIEPAEALRR